MAKHPKSFKVCSKIRRYFHKTVTKVVKLIIDNAIEQFPIKWKLFSIAMCYNSGNVLGTENIRRHCQIPMVFHGCDHSL